MPMWFVIFLFGFFVGGATLAALEVLGLFFLLKKLTPTSQPPESKSVSNSSSVELDTCRSLENVNGKKGFVWVVESEKVPVELWGEKVPKEQKKKRKEVIEVAPTRKFAKLNDGSLFLTDPDGSSISIFLRGCQVKAVSSGSLPSGKWARKYPIRLENKTSAIYNASNTIYIFLETSWEKESWCNALRFTSLDDQQRQYRYVKVHEDFKAYLSSLNAAYPYFMKPLANLASDSVDKANSPDESSSKVRLFLKKLAKKATKAGLDSKGSGLSLGKLQPNQDVHALIPKTSVSSVVSDVVDESLQNLSHTPSRDTFSEMDFEDRFSADDGTLSWNLLITRLFFDAKSNADIKSAVKTRIQRTFSNMHIPSYIGEVKCSDLDLGSLPPYIHAIRVYPMDMNEVWSWEVDLQYNGGMILYIETRIEVQNQDLPNEIAEVNSDPNLVEDVSSDLLEDFQALRQLELPNDSADADSQTVEGDSEHGSSQAPASISRWKSLLKTVAKQVSQIPLSLSLRVSSLRGTLKILVKPPPSDRLWFAFTSDPEIDINLETAVGDHKISIVHIGTFLVNRLKQSFRDNMVLPNCESIYIPWMQAEKDDWVFRSAAPFIARSLEQTGNNTSAPEASPSKSVQSESLSEGAMASSVDTPESKQQKLSIVNSNTIVAGSSSQKTTIHTSKSLEDLKSPLIASAEQLDSWQRRNSAPGSPPLTGSSSQERPMGRRARMIGLGKKMGEKLEEKRRHIEEKGRNIVERIRNQ